MAQGKAYHDGHGVWVNYCGHVELTRQEKSDKEWTLLNYNNVDIPHFKYFSDDHYFFLII